MTALQGVKVLDLSRVLAGPWCTQSLADLGAEVWKVENPAGGDDTRSWLPPRIGEESTYFLCCNRTKRSIAIDMKSPRGREIIRDLAAKADILVENFKLGTLEALGLGFEDLIHINPRLIYCTISGYGRTGPRSGEPGYDFAIQAESGLMSITGEPDGVPIKLGVAITDIVTGMNATQAVLAALYVRERTGRGQLIDICLHDSAISLLTNVGSGYLAAGADAKRFGNAHPTVVPYQLFNTADGYFALAVGNDAQFRKLCASTLRRPDLASDPRFITNRARVENRDVLIAILQPIFSSEETATWLGMLKRDGIPAGRVRSVAEALDSPEAKERGIVLEVADRLHSGMRLMASPLGLKGTPPLPPVSPPRLGEHTRDILRDALLLDDSEIDRLRNEGAIG